MTHLAVMPPGVLWDANVERVFTSGVSSMRSMVCDSCLPRLPLCLVSIMVLAAAGVVGRAQSRANDIQGLQAAEAAYMRGDNRGALEALRAFLKDHPRQFQANELMGTVLCSEKKFSQCRHFLTVAAEASPESAAAHANLAADLAELHLNHEAEAEFQRALALDRDNPELNHNLGEFYIAAGKVAKAIPYLRASQQRNPVYGNGYDLALAEVKSGLWDDAQADIQDLLKKEQTGELHSLLGEVLENKHEYLEAAREFQQAALMDPSESNIFAWGAELLRHQTLNPAVRVFGDGVARFPKSWRLQVGLGVSNYLLGHNKEAVDALCAAIDLDAKDPRPYFFLARVHSIPREQAAEVTARFKRYVKYAPRDPKARFYYAMSLLGTDGEDANGADKQQIKELLQEAIRLDPRYAEAHLQLGILYAAESQDRAALAEFQRAVALDPKLSVARYRLGQMLFRLGHDEAGRKQIAAWKQINSAQQDDVARQQKQILKFLYGQTD